MRFFVLLLGLCFFMVIADRVSAESDRPNVLWLCSDDHAAYVAGCYGNSLARTPNLDRLAQQGMRFDRAYCNSPVCTASRASFITGRYPRTIGVTLLRTPLPEAELTLADLLKGAGYDTAAIGKMHFNSNLAHGFDLRLDMPDWAKELRARGQQPLPAGVEVLPQWKPFRDPAHIWLNGIHRPFGYTAADMPSTFTTEKAIEFLQTKRDKPFFAFVSYTEPHSPFHYPVEWRDKFDPQQMPVGKIGPEDREQIPAGFADLTEEQKQGIVASYYTATEWMDHNVGRVLDALEASGQAENTIVVYTGDHGYFLGHHGRFEKHSSYEQAVRSPLIVRYPKRVKGGQATDALVEFVDIVPTILQWCGVGVPENVQGESLTQVLTGETRSHRPYVVVEYAQNDEAMIRDADWKLVYIRGMRQRDDGYLEVVPPTSPVVRLYDLRKDPDEFQNVADVPENRQRRDRMLHLLAEHMKQTARLPEHVPDSDDPMVILEFCVQPRDVE